MNEDPIRMHLKGRFKKRNSEMIDRQNNQEKELPEQSLVEQKEERDVGS